jgi:hypothetical protein
MEPPFRVPTMTDPAPAKSLVYRLPRKFEFPFGYEISVVQGTPDKDDRAAEWDVDTRTIVVDRRLPPAEKRGAFLHELDHAWSDWKLWVAQNVPVKYPDAMDPDPSELDEDGPGDGTPQEGV